MKKKQKNKNQVKTRTKTLEKTNSVGNFGSLEKQELQGARWAGAFTFAL